MEAIDHGISGVMHTGGYVPVDNNKLPLRTGAGFFKRQQTVGKTGGFILMLYGYMQMMAPNKI